jgi:A/G-specific adenine glycosylase
MRPARARKITERLQAWFARHARDLPWRRQPSPWKTLMSEALLQQTQVSLVAERFPEFVRLFPSPRAMVRRGEGAVLQAWRGMGYYRRARSLHAAAVRIVTMHGGRVPEDPESLRALPGVGRYTAGAVASIGFGLREPIVDGNVARVLSRLANRPDRTDDRVGQAWCWQQATRMVQAAREPGVANEALMELGATVCTPTGPACGACPLRSICASHRAGTQHRIPPARARLARRPLVFHALVDVHGGLVAMAERQEGLWRGLLMPPLIEASAGLSPARLKALSGASRVGPLRATVEFATTHRQVRFLVHRARFGPSADLQRISLRSVTRQAVPAAGQRVIDAVVSASPRRATVTVR